MRLLICIVEETSHYNYRMQCIESMNMSVGTLRVTIPRSQLPGSQTRAAPGKHSVVQHALIPCAYNCKRVDLSSTCVLQGHAEVEPLWYSDIGMIYKPG